MVCLDGSLTNGLVDIQRGSLSVSDGYCIILDGFLKPFHQPKCSDSSLLVMRSLYLFKMVLLDRTQAYLNT